MADPIRFEIAHHGALWTLSRDGAHVADFSHLDKATHEAVRRARELHGSGSPAQVFVLASAERAIEIDTDPEPDNPDLAGDAAAFTPDKPL